MAEVPERELYQIADVFTRQDELLDAILKVLNVQTEILSKITGITPQQVTITIGSIGFTTNEIKKGENGDAWFNGQTFEVKALEYIEAHTQIILIELPNFVLSYLKVRHPRLLTRTTTNKDITSSALSKTTILVTKFRLVTVLIHLNAATSPTITVTFDSKDGSTYDTVLDKQTLVSNTDYFFSGTEGEMEFESGDQIKVDITSVSAIAGLTIITEEIP